MRTDKLDTLQTLRRCLELFPLDCNGRRDVEAAIEWTREAIGMDKAKLKQLIDTLAKGMTAARENADGQEKPGTIVLTRRAYEALYYASYDVKKDLEREAEG